MTEQIQAVYEKGVIRPIEPLELAEGERLEVVLLRRKRGAAQALAEIAELPIEGETSEFSGAEHDEILYPKKSDDFR